MALFAKGEGAGPARVALLHGFGRSHAAWAAIQPELARDAATLAYDLPGHGESHGFPDAGPAKVAAQAILADLAARGLDHVHLVGHSMGGAVAALMALFEPARVASLTLLAPGGFGPEINHRLLSRYAGAENEAALVTCLEAMTGWYSPVAPETVATTLAARAAPGRRETLAEIAKGLVKDGRQGQLPREKLAALAMPVTVVWGGLDNVLPVRQTHGLPPSFAVHLFPDLGHMLPEEAPAEMLAIIRRTANLPR